MGVAGAGKTLIGSRLARALGMEFVEGDDYHPAANVERMAAGVPLSDDDRGPWLAALGARIADARRAGNGLVVACSALKRGYRDLLREADPTLRFVHLTGSRGLIAERLEQRTGHYMPRSLLDSQFATLELPAGEEGVWTIDARDSPERIVETIVARAREG